MGILGSLALRGLGGILNLLTQMVNGTFSGAMGVIKKAFSATMSYHQEGISFGRQIGLTFQQSQAYTKALTASAAELGIKYGITADKVFELQRNLTQATGRQLMFNKAQAETQVQINKLLDTNVSNAITEQMMNRMGGQIGAVQGMLAKVYKTAMTHGLNAATYSDKVAKNLQLANKLSFRNGVDGIMKMTALSERLGFNLQSIEQAASNFREIDKSIENAAHLQMLGGAAGVYGSNPLTMAYEANYDPEAFTERITDMLKGLATFNAKTGVSEVNGMNMDFIRGIAQSVGMSSDEAVSIAKKQAESKYKESQFGSTILANPRYSDEMRDYILNTSYVENGKLMMNDVNGNSKEVSQMSPAEIADMMRLANMDEKDLLKNQAMTMTSIQEKIDGIGTSIIAKLAQGFNEAVPKISRLLEIYGPKLVSLAESAGNFIAKFFNDPWGALKDLWGNMSTTLKLILSAVLALKVASLASRVKFPKRRSRGPRARTRRNLARASEGESTNGSRNKPKSKVRPRQYIKNSLNAYNRHQKRAYAQSRASGNGRFKSIINSMRIPKASTPGLASKFTKLARVGRGITGGIGGLAATGLGMAGDYLLESGIVNKDSLGGKALNAATTVANSKTVQLGMLGSMFGPIGTAIGGGIGLAWDAGSAIKGDYDKWKEKNPDGGFGSYAKEKIGNLADGVKDTFNKVGEWGKGVWDKASSWISENGGSTFKKFLSFANPITLVASHWDKVSNFVGGTWNKVSNTVSNGAKSLWNNFKAGNNKILAIGKNLLSGIRTKVTQFASGFFNSAKSIFGNILNSVKGFLSRMVPKPVKDVVNKVKNVVSGHASGGIVGGSSYQGDKVITRVNSGEMILNKEQQVNLFNQLNTPISTLVARNDVKAKPVGEKEYIYIPKSTSTSNVNGNTVTVKDINVNINGTIRLDGGSFGKDIDARSLLNDSRFIDALKDIVKRSMNTDANGGRFMNDTAQMRGLPSQTAIWGHK